MLRTYRVRRLRCSSYGAWFGWGLGATNMPLLAELYLVHCGLRDAFGQTRSLFDFTDRYYFVTFTAPEPSAFAI